MPPESKPNELRISRIYDAPVKAVWDAWVDPEQVAKWWGPRGWSIKTHGKELRPGGFWRYTMVGPQGEVFENRTDYHVVETGSRLVYDHGGGDDRPPLFKVTVSFEERAGKTHMEMIMALPTAEAAAETKKFIKVANGNSTWDRLAEYLEDGKSGKDKFVINRTFSAPIETVYKMLTQPEHLAKWLPPTGFTMEFLRSEPKVGGRSRYLMTNGVGVTMYGSLTYRELTPSTRLVYEQDFRDSKDQISRHPFAPLWPETMLSTVTLVDEGDGETRVTVEWEPGPTATPDERAAFKKEKSGMMMGWTGSFDKLDDVLASAVKR